jgi:GT2 family glycosyltransferase
MNNGPILDEFFEKLARHTTYPDYEICVVDDGSTDDSVEILRRWRDSGRFPGFELAEQENRGVIATCNRAMEMASGDIFVRLDGDATIETPGWLELMLDFHATSDQVGMVVAKIVFDSGRIHSFGRNVICPEGLHDRGARLLEPVGGRTLDSTVERPFERDAAGGDEIAEVDAALGCCTLFSRATAERIGGIDPRYHPVWVEDDDFALAVRREGQKVFFLPDVRVLHQQGRRNPRHGAEGRKGNRAIALAGRVTPMALKRRLSARLAVSNEPAWRVELLQRHYAAWKEKWGFDPVNPDMDAIRSRWGGTEVCWASDPERVAAGREIAAAYRSRRPAPVGS